MAEVWPVIVDVVSWALLLAGSAFLIIGAAGILRLPDVFARMHGGGLIETMGTGLILIGLMFQGGLTLVTVKLILVFILLMYTNPTSTHALARAALEAGQRPWLGRVGSEPPKATTTDDTGGAPSKT